MTETDQMLYDLGLELFKNLENCDPIRELLRDVPGYLNAVLPELPGDED